MYRGKLRKDKKYIDVAVKTPKFGGKSSKRRKSYYLITLLNTEGFRREIREMMYFFQNYDKTICDNFWDKMPLCYSYRKPTIPFVSFSFVETFLSQI